MRILDDGPGFPLHILGRLGDPFTRLRTSAQTGVSRPEYEGMGLGLFIAKTLLERSGAQLRFANGTDASGSPAMPGAVVEVSWKRSDLEVPAETSGAVIGQNRHITA